MDIDKIIRAEILKEDKAIRKVLKIHGDKRHWTKKQKDIERVRLEIENENEPPINITDSERIIYDRILQVLDTRLDINTDLMIVAMLAKSIDTVNTCSKEISLKGLVFESGQNGYMQQVPYVAIRQKAYAEIIKFSSMLGMSPKDRKNLELEKQKEEDEDPLDKV